jgi:putative ABC transport system substrate-binding protein
MTFLLSNPDNPTYAPFLHDTEQAATALGLEVRAFEARGPTDLPGAIAAMCASGTVSLSDAMLFTQRDRVVELALKSKLPAMYPEAEFPAAGGLFLWSQFS